MAAGKIAVRAKWLNDNVFSSRPIDDEALGAMLGLGPKRAMELFKEIEEKQAQVKNPSGYLKAAARKEGLVPAGEEPARKGPAAGHGGRGAGGGANGQHKIEQRASWLSDKVFPDRPISADAVAAMVGMGVARAMELFKDLESKSAEVKNPSGYLIGAARREGFAPATGGGAATGGTKGGGGRGTGGAAAGAGGAGDNYKIEQRAQWLSDKLFPNAPIDADAVAAMQGMGRARAMELFKEIEAKAATMKNPSGYLKAAASREGFAPPEIAQPQRRVANPRTSRTSPATANQGAAIHDDANRQKAERRAAWLNAHVFASNPIDNEAIAAMIGMGPPRNMELFKELQEKGAAIRNPGAWLKAAAAREGFAPPGAQAAAAGGAQRPGKRGVWGGAPAAKRQRS